MQLQRRIESASLKQLLIAAAIVSVLILAWMNRHVIVSKIKSDVP